MKKMLFTLVSMLTIAAAANAMSYEQARNEALFLTDKMAYELNLNDAQYEAAYEINLPLFMAVGFVPCSHLFLPSALLGGRSLALRSLHSLPTS